MSEPSTRASFLTSLAPGLRHWTIHDERIGFRSESYAMEASGQVVVIDPLPLTEEALDSLGRVIAIVLTGGFHQRAAWSFRRRFGAPVHAPRWARGLDEQPDSSFEDGALLDGGLLALDRPGPGAPHYVLLWRPPGLGSVLFAGDLLMRETEDAPFRFVSDEHQQDPALTRESVRRMLDRPVELLCPAHGPPALAGGTQAMRDALERDARRG